MAGAGGFAEAALDAQVVQFVGQRHDLEVLDVHLLVAIEQLARVEQPLGVEDRIDSVHSCLGLGA
ncbi:hypothetical protein, partial [Devosia chinhatensis]